ncbi:MAG TPA: FtsX-like permease family protein [Chitinophagaceae bacterium]|nr:FtsX-like permease family protein [Chitinophagaceae bacterium]
MIWKFAFRYIKAKKSAQAINIISWVSMSAIAVGTTALIVVLSVFNGFEGLVKSLYSSFYPELKVSPIYGKTMIVSPEQLDSLKAVPSIDGLSKSLEEKALLRNGREKMIVELKGVDSAFHKVTGVQSRIIRGLFDLGTAQKPKAVFGAGVASILGIDAVSNPFPVTIYLPKANGRVMMMPQSAFYTGTITPAGTFAIQQDFDNKYVLTNLGYLQSLMGKGRSEISAIELSLVPGADKEKVQKRVSSIFPSKKFKIETRYEQNRSLYLVMQTEKWAVYAILCFIFIIAAFNMIGALSMLVIEKRKDISILKAMGAGHKLIQRIFLAEGLLVSFSGAAVGTVIALLVCLGQQHFGWVKLGGGTFVINAYPVDMHWIDFVLVWVTILFVSLLASWYPAIKAAKQPMNLKSE